MWYLFPDNIPSDGQICYIRLNYNSYNVFTANYNVSAQTFVSTSNSIIYPAYMILKWKAV
jgi:hypothetical protein